MSTWKPLLTLAMATNSSTLAWKISWDRGAWWAAVHGVAKSGTRLNDFTFTFHFHALEKEMAAHSSVLAWKIPGMAEPGGLPSMGLHRVIHDWSELVAPAKRFNIHIMFKLIINTKLFNSYGIQSLFDIYSLIDFVL